MLSDIEVDATIVKWAIGTYAIHNEEMRKAEYRFQDERDRRYTEVNVEKEKALKIKETADLAALSLARESQVYKDQQADVMREKNLAASGVYATNADLAVVVEKMEKALKPLTDFVSSQRGVVQNNQINMAKIFGIIAATGTVVGILVFLVNNVFK